MLRTRATPSANAENLKILPPGNSLRSFFSLRRVFFIIEKENQDQAFSRFCRKPMTDISDAAAAARPAQPQALPRVNLVGKLSSGGYDNDTAQNSIINFLARIRLEI